MNTRTASNNNVLNKIKCLQINLQRSKASTAHLNQFIINNNYDIVLVQEPYIVKSKVCGFPVSHRVFYNETVAVPKNAIVVVNSKIQVLFIQSVSNEFSTFINVEFRRSSFTLVSAYCSPLEDINRELTHIKEALTVINPRKVLIGFDSNAKSRVWFSDRDDTRGNAVNEFVAEMNLIVMNNNPEMPTFSTTRGESYIDLTLINLNSANFVYNWQTLEFDSMSDHRYIEYTIADDCSPIVFKTTIKYNINNANWDSFEAELLPVIQYLSSEMIHIQTYEQLNTFVEVFSSKLTIVCDKVFKNKSFSNFKKTNKWWSRELTVKRRLMNSARRRYQRSQTGSREQLKQLYLDIKQSYKQLLIKSKTDSWFEFISLNTRDNPWGLVYKLSQQKVKVDKISEFIDSNGTLITDNRRIAETLLNSLFPDDNPSTDNDYHKEIRQKVDAVYNCADDLMFNELEVTEIVNKQNISKSPGEDGFNALIVKNFHKIDPSFLTNLYNKCLTIGVFPEKWKSSVIKVIRKSGNRDYTKPNAYRPISLLSVFAKILEKLLINRINYYLNINGLLNENQYGFTPQKSTTDAIHSAVNFIRQAFERHGYALLIALDIVGAFDNAWWPMILNCLREMACPGNLYRLTKSYFSNRTAKLWFQNIQVSKRLTKGCPQGSSCGPGFWNVIFNKCLQLSFSREIQSKGFADDTLLLTFAESISELELKTNEALSMLSKWALNNKLEFSPSKTSAVLFTRNIKNNNPKILLNGQVLQLANSLKYLGIHIDRHLNWKIHINYVKTKAQQLTMQLLLFAKRKCGLNTRALEIIYKGAIIPILSYGCSVWIKDIDKNYISKALESIQRSVALRLCYAYKTVSTQALNVIANLMPLDLVVKQRAIEYAVKHEIQLDICEEYFKQLNIDLTNVQKPFQFYDLPHPAITHKLNIIQDTNDSYLTNDCRMIYTDGSKSSQGVGAGFCSIMNQRFIKRSKFKLASYCSVFQAELFAILQALKHIKGNHNKTIQICICTDSLTVIKALQQTRSTNQLIQKIMKEVARVYGQGIQLSFCWIQAHNGNVGNETADSLAKAGAISHRSIDYDIIPMNFIKKAIYQKNLEIWNERYTNTQTGETTKRYFATVFDRLKIKKVFYTNFYFTQFLTNHGNFSSYLNRFRLKIDPYCAHCTGVIGNAEHIIYDCPMYCEQRQLLIEVSERNGIHWPCTQSELTNIKLFKQFNNFCNQIFKPDLNVNDF
jgi:ribonuclease HI